MSEESEFNQQHREAQQARRKERLPRRTNEIEMLGAEGYEVIKKTDYQFRINGLIDVYPIHRRYHILKTGKRGTYPANELSNKIKQILSNP